MPMIPITLVKEGVKLNYFSMITTVGTPQTVTAEELRLECMFPADDATEAALCHAADDDVMQVERAVEINRDHLVPERAIGIEERNRKIPARHVGQQLDRSGLAFEGVDGGFDLRPIGDVGSVGKRRPAPAGAEPKRLLHAVLVEIDDSDR